VADVADLLDRQIACNTAIAREGISGRWGAGVGRTLLDMRGDSVMARAGGYGGGRLGRANVRVRAAGGDQLGQRESGHHRDAAAGGVRRELDAAPEALYRALILANLTAIRLKALIGCLSAYCGAISAGCAAGAGVCYLCGGSLYQVNHTVVNSLAILSGTICDAREALLRGEDRFRRGRGADRLADGAARAAVPGRRGHCAQRRGEQRSAISGCSAVRACAKPTRKFCG
jgi:hypothetical protein